MNRPQLADLANRIPSNYIKQLPGVSYDAHYTGHADIQQMLLAKIGPVPQRIVKIIYGNDGGTIHGVILEMVFNIDEEKIVIEEIGETERPGDNNATNLKMAVSDGVKRCSMRVGLGLELWTDNYRLDKALEKRGEYATD